MELVEKRVPDTEVLVVEALVATRVLVVTMLEVRDVADAVPSVEVEEVRAPVVSVDTVVVASVVTPFTVSVPPTVWLPDTEEVPVVRVAIVALVVVEFPTTRLVMLTSVATRDEKNPEVVVLLVVIALVVVLVPIVTPVRFAIVAKRLETKELEEVLLEELKLVIVAEAAVRVLAVRLEVDADVVMREEMVVVASVDVPDTARDDADAVPRDEVPAVSVEKIPVVKVGLRETAMVLVPEKMMLDPATRFATGLLKKESQAVVDAVRGREYPACVPRVKVWIPVEVAVEIKKERPPEDDVANACDAAALPLRVEIVPPAPPASVPQ
jgi:hypothetical protein